MTEMKRIPLFNSARFTKQTISEPVSESTSNGFVADPLDMIRVCNCCECGMLLFADAKSKIQAKMLRADVLKENSLDLSKMEIVRGKILGRPYCDSCLDSRSETLGGGIYIQKGETSPAWENAIRMMEG